MRKVLALVVAIVLISVNAFAASSMTPNLKYFESKERTVRIISIVCTAHTDGTFNNYTLSDSNSIPYYQEGFFLADVFSVNSATDDHTSGAVTITDASTRQLIGTTAGDTLTLSTAASGVGYLSVTRGVSQRSVSSPLVIAVSDTGSTAVVFTLYLVLVK